MRCTVVHLYGGTPARTFSGTPEQIKRELFRNYPHLYIRCGYASSVEDIAKQLNSYQAYVVSLDRDEDAGITLTEGESLTKALPDVPSVLPVTDGSESVAEHVRVAIALNQVTDPHLPGKHGAGTRVVHLPHGGAYLLKPGTNEQAALGASDIKISQQMREYVFARIARDVFGLDQHILPVHLISINGATWTVENFLDGWHDFNHIKRVHGENGARRILMPYALNEMLYKWAAVDYVLGNPDRHAGNIMSRDGDIVLVDHASALAGASFSPHSDPNSYVPYYLRTVARVKLEEAKMSHWVDSLPEPTHTNPTWLESVDSSRVVQILERGSIDTAPFVTRLQSLQKAARHLGSLARAVAIAWVL